MKLTAQVTPGSFARRLARVRDEVERAALDAAADALASELTKGRERDALDAPLLRGGAVRGRFIAANDSESLVRELGSPVHAPAPWLAPVLPAARAPMRAAASQAVARALSRFKR